MPRLFWIAMALIGGGLILLVLNHEGGSTLGLDNDVFASTLYLGILGLVLGAGVFAYGQSLGHVARNLAAWLAIILVLVAGYQYRYELQDVASRLTAGLVPGSPLSVGFAEGGTAVRLDKLDNGHFEVRGTVDGATVHFVVDTGATTTVLTAEDARRAGIEVAALSFTLPVSTANGVTQAARTRARELAIGTIERRDFPVLVAAPGSLGQSLLGMNFIGSLSAFEMRGDVMILRD